MVQLDSGALLACRVALTGCYPDYTGTEAEWERPGALPGPNASVPCVSSSTDFHLQTLSAHDFG